MSIQSSLTALADAVRSKSGVSSKLSIDGMTAAVNGITVGGGAGISFYECTEYTPDFAGGFEYTMNVTAADRPEAIGEYKRTKYIDPIDENIEEYSGYTAVWEKTDGSGVKLTESFSYGEYYYSFVGSDGYELYYQDSSAWSRVTDYNTISWVDPDSWEPASVTFSAWIPSELPPTVEAWSGYKMVQGDDGVWQRTDIIKENMTAPGYTPQVGTIYSEDTSIAVRAMATPASQSLVALYHFDGDFVDSTGNTSASMHEKSLDDSGRFGGSLYGDTYNSVQYDSSYYMQIIGLPALDAFTIEWWQKDDDGYGDGGAFMWQPEENGLSRSSFLTVPILKDDKRYIQGKWKHLAFVRAAGSSTVTQYLNGQSIGTFEFADKIGGRTVNFGGLAPTTGQAKTIRIDELAFYGVVKYTGNFTPPDVPTIT